MAVDLAGRHSPSEGASPRDLRSNVTLWHLDKDLPEDPDALHDLRVFQTEPCVGIGVVGDGHVKLNFLIPGIGVHLPDVIRLAHGGSHPDAGYAEFPDNLLGQ